MKIKRIAIVGGGTAGWLAANHLGFELRKDPEIEITLIESKDVPSIGVGEGTVPYIKKALEKFGISEAELIASCDVTFKQGIKFVEWLNSAIHGEKHYYYHPFESPFPSGIDIIPYWLNHRSREKFHEITAQSYVCEAKLCPKKISSPPYQGEMNYAYHFDAIKFAKLLSRNAISKYRVKHKIATVVGAQKDDAGNIDSLMLGSGESSKFDFYIDCSGFSSLLIEKELSVPFVDKSNQILTDTALALQVQTETGEEIPPYTIATAHKAGWVWDITLTGRRGTGFIYSSQHMSETEAVEGFSKYLGVDVEMLSPRKISMPVGYREEFWVNNCVAIGLSQGFVEPLEATSILITDFSAEYLARAFPVNVEDISLLKKRYNKVVEYSWARILDFIKLHYCISDRDDSDFWRENRDMSNVSDVLVERLSIWEKFHPKKSDFFSKFEVFDVENYLYILYGMKFYTVPPHASAYDVESGQGKMAQVRQDAERLAVELLGHREWLDKLKKAMQPG